MRHKDGQVTTPLTVTQRDLSKNGVKPVHKIPRSTLWAKHDVDQQAGLHGKRYATRMAGSTAQYGRANDLAHMDAAQFMVGYGLRRHIRSGPCRITYGGVVIGRAPDLQTAIAYRIAALRVGVELEVYND